jgi:hypothetical protein
MLPLTFSTGNNHKVSIDHFQPHLGTLCIGWILNEYLHFSIPSIRFKREVLRVFFFFWRGVLDVCIFYGALDQYPNIEIDTYRLIWRGFSTYRDEYRGVI